MKRTTRIFCMALVLLLALTAPALAFEELSKGSKGDAVVKLQNKLNELGYSVGTADGDFGGKTAAALQQFQTDKGLEATGILNEATYNALFGTETEALTRNEDAKVMDAWPALSSMYFLMDDGTVIKSEQTDPGGNPGDGNTIEATDVASISKDGGTNVLLFHSDGKITQCFYKEFGFGNKDNWEDLVLVGASFSHAVGLKRDGTWIFAGEYNDGERDVEGWTDIVQLQVGDDYTVGLKADGTVVATGENWDGRCNVSQWTDIVKIAVSPRVSKRNGRKLWTLGLKSDGTVVVAGGDNKSDETFVEGWSNVIDIYAGYEASFGLTSDGKILSTDKRLYDYVAEDYKCENAIRIEGKGDGDAPILIRKADNTIEAFGKDADIFNSYLNGAEIRINDASSQSTASADSMTFPDDAETNAQMKALMDAFKGLGEAVDTNGDGQLSIDEIFK